MASGEGRRRRRRPALITLLIVLAAVVLAVDQVSKQVALNTLTPGEYHPLIGDFFGLSLVFNPGAAFSLGEGSTWLFTIAMAVVTVVIIVVARRLASRGWAVALGALLGGTLGNLGDRLFRDPGFAVGHVVDFLNYNGWFVGNIADVAIVLSAAGIAVLSFVGIGVDGRRAAATEHDGDASAGRHVASGEEDEGDERGRSTGDGAEGAEDDPDDARTADDDATAGDGDVVADDGAVGEGDAAAAAVAERDAGAGAEDEEVARRDG